MGTPEHFMFNFQHPQQCGKHQHQEMASYGPVYRRCVAVADVSGQFSQM